MPWAHWSFDQVMTHRPAIRVNQLGYLPGRPMQATLVSGAEHSVEFGVRDRRGVVILNGRSQPWPVRPEPTSGLSVHLLDFTGLRARGAGFRVEAAGQRSHPFVIADDLYGRLSADALRFFTVMRSGMPILDGVAPGYGRPAGHVGRPPNRGDVTVPAWSGPDAERLYPGWRCQAPSTCRAAGTTQVTTASTSPAGRSRCGSC